MRGVRRRVGSGRSRLGAFLGGALALARTRLALLRLLRSAGWPTVAGLVGIELVVVLLPVATAVAIGVLVARVVEFAGEGADVWAAAGPVAVVGVLLMLDLLAQSVLGPLRDWASLRVNGQVRSEVREVLAARAGIDHLEDQSVRDDAELVVNDRWPHDLGAAAEGQLWLMMRFVGAAGSAALLATYSLPLAVFVFVVLATQRAVLRQQYVSRRVDPVAEVQRAYRGVAYWQQVGATPQGAKEVRLFGFPDWVVGQFAIRNREVLDARSRLFLRVLPQQWITFVLSTIAAGVPFVVLTRAALAGDLSTAHFAVTLGAVVGLFFIGAMGWEAYPIEEAPDQFAALRRLRAGLEATAPVRPVAKAATGPVPAITFEKVSFRYPGSAVEVLRELQLEIPPGEALAIVGENGAGKSTLIKLLSGFYEPTAGRILVDGIDLRELDPVAWRVRLAVIFQDFVHFELSALDNVTLASLDRLHGRADAEAAAEAAGARPLIEGLPWGWETVLSRGYVNGAELSGGEWQRIALARALYAARGGAGVLVLDEPTANLDVLAETALFDQLLRHASGLTAIVISHRFSTVRRARRIVVLDEGRVAEDGSHESLMRLGGLYAQLYELQAAKFDRSAAAAPTEPAEEPE